MTPSLREHWNKKYTDSPITQLSWYESKPIQSIQLIENCGVPKSSTIIDVGSGTSTLIANPSDNILQLQNVAVWHDRAVFHFLSEVQHRQTYHSLLQKTVMPNGFVIMATFAMNGATKFSGLSVQRYSAESLS